MSEAKLSTVILVFTVVGVAAYVISSGPQAIENVWRKIKLVGFGTLHMLLSRDKRFKPEVSSVFTVIRVSKRMRISYFTRRREGPYWAK